VFHFKCSCPALPGRISRGTGHATERRGYMLTISAQSVRVDNIR
jgi:hypothetical protein